MSTHLMADQVLAIAEDLFTAMIDGEPGTLALRAAPAAMPDDAVSAWVDVAGGHDVRAVLTAPRPTADDLARALLALGPAEPVSEDDLVDAMGELANVVGGNVKGLLPGAGALGLPVVRTGTARPAGTLTSEVALAWRGAPVTVSLWKLDEAEGVQS